MRLTEVSREPFFGCGGGFCSSGPDFGQTPWGMRKNRPSGRPRAGRRGDAQKPAPGTKKTVPVTPLSIALLIPLSKAGPFSPFSKPSRCRSGPEKTAKPRVSDLKKLTPVFLIYEFLTDRKSPLLRFWAAPGGRETFQKGGGLRPPPFWKASRPPGAAQNPKIDDFRSVKKSYIKNIGVSF